jgi:hypothetical protein
MSIEAMKQALEALEKSQPVNYCENSYGEKSYLMVDDPFKFERNDKAITALRQAIEQTEKNSGKCGCGANLYVDENGKACSKNSQSNQGKGKHMSKIDIIIDALSVAQNSVWSALNEQALAAARKLQAEKQEPVAWDGNCVLGHCGSPDGCDRSGCCRANTAPPKREWVGLTGLEVSHYNSRLSRSGVAEEIQAKLRERNT